MKKITVLILCVFALISCQKDNSEKILSVNWTSDNDGYNVIIKDSTIQFNVLDFQENTIGEENYFNKLTLKIKHISKTKIYTTGDKNHLNDSINYGIKFINEKPILILNCKYAVFSMPQYKSIAFTTESVIDLAESKGFNDPLFDIDGYKLNDTIDLDSVSYFSNILFNYNSLLKNPDIEFLIIGNKIVSIKKNNIKEYEINDILNYVDKKFKRKHTKISDSYYIWINRNCDYVQLAFDLKNKFDGENIFYALYYSNSSVKSLAKLEFKDNVFYENIRIRKEKVMSLLPSDDDSGRDLHKLSNDMSKILLIDNKYYEAYFVLAQLANIQQNTVGAKQNFIKCLELNPYHINALIGLGQIYYDTKEYDNFLSCMFKAMKLSPKTASIYRALTAYYYNIKNDKEAACTYANLAYENGDSEMLSVLNDLCIGQK